MVMIEISKDYWTYQMIWMNAVESQGDLACLLHSEGVVYTII